MIENNFPCFLLRLPLKFLLSRINHFLALNRNKEALVLMEKNCRCTFMRFPSGVRKVKRFQRRKLNPLTLICRNAYRVNQFHPCRFALYLKLFITLLIVAQIKIIMKQSRGFLSIHHKNNKTSVNWKMKRKSRKVKFVASIDCFNERRSPEGNKKYGNWFYLKVIWFILVSSANVRQNRKRTRRLDNEDLFKYFTSATWNKICQRVILEMGE